MKKVEQQNGKMFIIGMRILLVSIVFVLLSALTPEFEDLGSAAEERIRNIDQRATVTIKATDKASMKPLESGDTKRTLFEYYARRQYLGSPPAIPHPDKVHGEELECLICHADGGWTRLLKRMTPVTPHPELTGCLQCHVNPTVSDLFRGTDWQSLPPPLLGRAYLPGAPPPIPHDLQMRGNCNACHVGPGTLWAIRMKHQWRGECRQCHLPDLPAEAFSR